MIYKTFIFIILQILLCCFALAEVGIVCIPSEEHSLLLREQNYVLQYLIGLISMLAGIVLGYVFLSGLKLR